MADIGLKTFKYKGVSARGRSVKGKISEISIESAKSVLLRNGITKINISEKKSTFAFKTKIKRLDILIFTRQLASMLKSGLPIMNALDIIIDGLTNPTMKVLIMDVRNHLQSGDDFSQAVSRHPNEFDQLYCALVQAGEKSGKLENMLERIAVYMERSEAVKKKIKKALTYPVIVIVASIIATMVLMIKVIPVFKDMFESFGSDLPFFTQVVVAISETLQAYWYYAVIFVVIAYIGFKKHYKSSESFRRAVATNMLKLPIIGNIVYQSIIARFSQTLSITFGAGVPLIDALDSASKSCDNIFFEEIVQEVKSDVQTGVQLNFAMQTSCLFPPMAVQMTSIGEESGALDEMLDKVAMYYEEEVDSSVDKLTTMIEPLIMAILAIVIGGLVIAMYLPLLTMGSVV